MKTLLSPAIFLIMAAMFPGCASEPGFMAPRVSSYTAGGPGADEPTSLPAYARPTGSILDPADYDGTDVIHYRSLQRSDFKGVDPPPHMAPYRDRLGATTCAYIVTTDETQIFVQPVVTRGGTVRYEATPRGLGFRAQMDRSCSWWNSTQSALRADYILEHEQIHFALFELEARRLNAEVSRLVGELKTTDGTVREARMGVLKRLEGVLSESLRAVLARSHAFDEQTSMGYRPEKQKIWLRRVESELSRSQLAL